MKYLGEPFATLEQIINYIDLEDYIQVCYDPDPWDKFEEVPSHSEHLKPYWNYTVIDMGIEPAVRKNHKRGEKVLRVALEWNHHDER
jgi:hypothetical protein